MTVAGTWQGLRDQMSLKPRDLRKKCAGSRDSDHIIKNYWESGLGLFTIAFSGDFYPKIMSESAPRALRLPATALTSDCSVCLYQPRTSIVRLTLSMVVDRTIFNWVTVTPGGNSTDLGGRLYHFKSALRVEIMLPTEYRKKRGVTVGLEGGNSTDFAYTIFVHVKLC